MKKNDKDLDKLIWSSYKGRESIVEKFMHNGKVFVREAWPMQESREHATLWEGSGLVKLDREVILQATLSKESR